MTARFQSTSPYDGVWWNGTLEDATDWYFFGHGHAYRAALADFTAIAGAIALPPKSAFGPWWSRYYNYSQVEFTQEVLQGYANYSIPLENAVMDMDWHEEPTDPTCSSWGGFDFNTALFPDPAEFIAWLNGTNVVGHPLTLSLNLHPQTGETRACSVCVRACACREGRGGRVP